MKNSSIDERKNLIRMNLDNRVLPLINDYRDVIILMEEQDDKEFIESAIRELKRIEGLIQNEFDRQRKILETPDGYYNILVNKEGH